MSGRELDKFVLLIALLLPIPSANADLPEGMPRTVPTIGRWMSWVAAEVEYQRVLQIQPPVDGYPYPIVAQKVEPLRQMALADPAAAELWALLMREHSSPEVVHLALTSIAEARNTALRTPAVRQVLWFALYDQRISYSYRDTALAALQKFGPGQLKPLSDAELLFEIGAATNSFNSMIPMWDDAFFELYLHEVLARKLTKAVPLLETIAKPGSFRRQLLVRTVQSRLLGKPDPITFKAWRNADDPTLCEIEATFSDHQWIKEVAGTVAVDRFNIRFDVYAVRDRMRTLWMQKMPPEAAWTKGKPIRTTVSTGLIKGPLTLEVEFRLEDELYGSVVTAKPNDLVPHPTLQLQTVVTVDMSSEK